MEVNSKFNSFLKLTAICSILGAVTTALLIFLPNPPSNGFEESTMLYKNKLYLSKLWILFIHPQVNFLASLGIAFLLFRKYPLQVIVGTFFMLIWAMSEMGQQALLIDALNQYWRPGYLSSEDDATKQLFETLIRGASGISDSHYFLVLFGFGLGSFFYGLAMVRELQLARWIGIALIFIGVLSIASFSRYYLGMSFFDSVVNWSYKWIYPYLQPAVRIAIGVWIWKQLAPQKQL